MAAAYIVNCETKDGSAELSSFSRDARSHKSDEMMLLEPSLSWSARSSSSQPSHDLLLWQSLGFVQKLHSDIFFSNIVFSIASGTRMYRRSRCITIPFLPEKVSWLSGEDRSRRREELGAGGRRITRGEPGQDTYGVIAKWIGVIRIRGQKSDTASDKKFFLSLRSLYLCKPLAGFEVGVDGVRFLPSNSNDSNPFCNDVISILPRFSSKFALPLLVPLFYVISFFACIACSEILKVLMRRKSPYTSSCCHC